VGGGLSSRRDQVVVGYKVLGGARVWVRRNGRPLDQKARLGFRKRKVGVVFSNIEHIIGVGYT
jgi:hypothetical protein